MLYPAFWRHIVNNNIFCWLATLSNNNFHNFESMTVLKFTNIVFMEAWHFSELKPNYSSSLS